MVPVSESESSRSDKSSRSGHSDRGRDEGKLDETTTSDSTPKSSSAQASDADPSSESETSSGTDVRYRRVGDEIRLIDGSPSTLSSNGADTLVSDTNGTSDPSDDSSRTERTESTNPSQNLNDTVGASPSLFLPQPDLPSADTGPTLRTPED